MKFSAFATSLAFVGLVSAAAIPETPIVEGTVQGVEAAAGSTLANIKRDDADALSGATYGVTSSLNGLTGIAGSLAGTAESTTSGAVGTVESTATGILPAKRELDAVTGALGGTVDTTVGATTGAVDTVVPATVNGVGSLTKGLARRELGGLTNVVDASLKNDLGMLTGNPSGLIGALEGLHVALANGDITQGQLSGIPVELEHVVGYLYTA